MPVFDVDEISLDAVAEVDTYPSAIGSTSDFNHAVTRQDALRALEIFLDERLFQFGPYEDAMTARSATLFHSGISPYLNLGLLEPLECIKAAEARFKSGMAPIASVEGFVRQILGWREFMYWQYWRLMPDLLEQNYWEVHLPLPDFFWTGDTPLRCLNVVIGRVLASGYAHHIERLMILSNFMLLFGVEPIQANAWFLQTFVDAFEWVMPPNVIGMGLYADGGIIASKPYISSANYINRMSDYCRGCSFDPKQRDGEQACPFNFLYWDFHLKYEARLRANPRMSRGVLHLKRFSVEDKKRIESQATAFRESQGSAR
jgi:deoxyribodipyrimidine photolyase-related protein